MAICCPKPVRACALRATLLDECGVPVDIAVDPNTQIATKQFISLAMTPDIEEGEEFRQKNACGDICINDNEDCDKLLGFDLTLQMCGLPTHMYALLMGMNVFVDGDGDVIGGVLPNTNFSDVDAGLGCGNKVQLEVWSRNSDRNRCDDTGNVWNYIRWILPETSKWQISGDTTFTNDILSVELSGYAQANTQFNSSIGLVNDPDLTQEFVDGIQAGGPLAWVCSDEIPTNLSECDYTNPVA